MLDKRGEALVKYREEIAACIRDSNSFTPTTPVLMADGAHKPIKDLRIGQRILATDPTIDVAEARTVSDIIVSTAKKNLVEITLGTDDATGNAAATVNATEGHSFWVANRGSWLSAKELRAGDQLRTPQGELREIVNTRKWTGFRKVYNLTVDGVHTYYVLAGNTPVLVHNATCGAFNAVMGWKTRHFDAGGDTLRLTKERMQHILERHHPKYRKGPDKTTQTNFSKTMSIDDIADAVGEVVQQNRGLIIKKGIHEFYYVEGVYKGVHYQMGISSGRIGNFFPLE
ncbi:polymorphic toxin-type HINT domain-containing protein [Streptomyces varsoviensis]|uniref:polymorphic toxin-type HINT domain-containing protein n=1 Tax=Streptomyces varsoviensis TaxID=67373 RepID=UPI00340CF1DC